MRVDYIYLFRALLTKLHPELTQEIAILDIRGKDNYEIWKTFFEAFGLEVFFICDLDNVFSLEFSGSTIIEKSEKEIIESALKQHNLDNLTNLQKTRLTTAYAQLAADTNFLTQPKRELWKPLCDAFISIVNIKNKELSTKILGNHLDIDAKIEEKYEKNVYILKKGSIEDYIETDHGNLTSVINFCENNFDSWVTSSTPEFQEIQTILNKICLT